MTNQPLCAVSSLRFSVPDLNHKPLFGPAPILEILKNINLEIPRGSVMGIVGESGSGKSTLGRCLVRLNSPSEGKIVFDGKDIAFCGEDEIRPLRKNLQMIFQDPMSSLNPRRKIGQIVASALMACGEGRAQAKDKALFALDHVGLSRDFASRYPHQLSGGQRQRVGIARAIALEPKFIVADEIVSGLDVSNQAQIIVLLEKLVTELDLTLAFISHDLSIVRRLCDRVAVMRAGEIVEQESSDNIFKNPSNEYTKTLLDAAPLPEITPGWI